MKICLSETVDAPIIREVFNHKEYIYLCKSANGESLADGILELKKDKNLRLRIAENGHKKFKSHFTPKAIGKELLKAMNINLDLKNIMRYEIIQAQA